jgi:hypothetical protein
MESRWPSSRKACIRSANRDRANSVTPQLGRAVSDDRSTRIIDVLRSGSTPTVLPNTETG